MSKILKWKFGQYLREHKITPYRLELALQGCTSRRISYDWAKTPPERLHLDVLAKVLSALETLTGKPVAIEDIMEFETPPETASDNDTQWLDAELTKPLPPYDWGKSGAAKGKPIKHVPGVGFVIEGSRRVR